MKRMMCVMAVLVVLCLSVFPDCVTGETISDADLDRIAALNLPMEKMDQASINGQEMMGLLDLLVAAEAPEKAAEWQQMYPQLREHLQPLTRFDAMAMLFLASQFIGGNYILPETDEVPWAVAALQFPFDHYYFTEGLFSGIDEQTFHMPVFGDGFYLDFCSLYYNLWREVPGTGGFPFDYDAENNSIHEFDPPTYAEAVRAVARLSLIGGLPGEDHSDPVPFVNAPADDVMIPVTDPAARRAGNVITEALNSKASEAAAMTAENHPRWTGFVFGYGYEYQFGTTTREIDLSAEWGFNSVKLDLHYLTLFDPEAGNVRPSALQYLDELIAAAIRNNIHFTLCLTSIPGHTANYLSDNYEYQGSFDLFVNPERQEQAFGIFRLLAARYKDVPNCWLSFMPIWSPLNMNLSTGLPYPDYTEYDVADVYGKAVDAIRSEDPDRLVIYEAEAVSGPDMIISRGTPVREELEKRGNVIFSCNFAEAPFIYACMTDTEGYHIDTMNRSMYLPDYPNYIYGVTEEIRQDTPVTMDGFLPAGTKIEIYLKMNDAGTILDITADGNSICREELPQAEYETGRHLAWLYPFAESTKSVSATLEADTQEVVLSCLHGRFQISGIALSFPEEYAVEKWYNVQPYDVFTGEEQEAGIFLRKCSEVLISPNGPDGRHVTVHEDMTYSSERILQEASRETIEEWCRSIAGFAGNCVVRYERADTSGTTWENAAKYYEDMLSAFKEYGFGWWSGDWYLMTDEYAQTHNIVGADCIEYAGYPCFNKELLELLQKYQ